VISTHCERLFVRSEIVSVATKKVLLFAKKREVIQI
jgi:hypothetical protein